MTRLRRGLAAATIAAKDAPYLPVRNARPGGCT